MHLFFAIIPYNYDEFIIAGKYFTREFPEFEEFPDFEEFRVNLVVEITRILDIQSFSL